MWRDLNKPANEILTDLIFKSNGIFFRYGDIQFGVPDALAVPIGSVYNTMISVSSDMMEDDRFSGCTSIYYRRIPFSELEIVFNTPLQQPSFPFTVSSLLPQINAIFNTQIQATDIVDQEYQDLSQPIILTAAPGCLCYTGSVALRITGTLAVEIDTVDLNGFANRVGCL